MDIAGSFRGLGGYEWPFAMAESSHIFSAAVAAFQAGGAPGPSPSKEFGVMVRPSILVRTDEVIK